MVIDDGEQRTLRYGMNFEDVRNPACQARLMSFEGPKNMRDLHRIGASTLRCLTLDVAGACQAG